MRKWQVRLYRYGLRLTYDLTIPEPAGALRQAYAYLQWLKSQIGPFAFNVHHSEITPDIWSNENETQPHYLVLADRYGAQVPYYPQPEGPLFPNQLIPGLGGGWHWFTFNFNVPNGNWIKKIRFQAHIGDDGSNYYKWAMEGITYEWQGKAQYWDEIFHPIITVNMPRGHSQLRSFSKMRHRRGRD